MKKIFKNKRPNHMIILFTLFLAGSLSSLSCYKTQGSEAIAKKMPTILLNLVNSHDPVSYAKNHGITLKNGMVRVIITVDTSLSSKDFLSKYDLMDYQLRKDLVTAYISIDGLKKLCEDPAVIYVRLPLKFNSR
jgi:hypothetical protein